MSRAPTVTGKILPKYEEQIKDIYRHVGEVEDYYARIRGLGYMPKNMRADLQKEFEEKIEKHKKMIEKKISKLPKDVQQQLR